MNKVNSKAQLRWNIVESTSLTQAVKDYLLEKLANRLTTEGEILISSDRFRDQTRNREDCLEKLSAMINEALKVPVQRKATRPSKSSKRKKRENKSMHSNKKALRKSPSGDHS